MEIILKISTNKKLITLFCFLSLGLYSQNNTESNSYREDQFYFASSYFIQTESIKDFKQNGFSGNFQFGFIRDFPLNKDSTRALGLGLGYERNYFTSNIQPIEQDDQIDYRIVVSRFLESKNKISFSSISFPIEYRWRKSSLTNINSGEFIRALRLKRIFRCTLILLMDLN